MVLHHRLAALPTNWGSHGERFVGVSPFMAFLLLFSPLKFEF
jgi:hypothetical protein